MVAEVWRDMWTRRIFVCLPTITKGSRTSAWGSESGSIMQTSKSPSSATASGVMKKPPP